MSGINGDKSRFHRRRKEKIQRRAKQRAMLDRAVNQADSPTARSPRGAQEKSA
jgi:hypothetical protein